MSSFSFIFSYSPAWLLKKNPAQLFSWFSTVAEQLVFIKLLQVVDSASVAFSKRYSSNVIQVISCELQSQWSSPEFVYIIVG